MQAKQKGGGERESEKYIGPTTRNMAKLMQFCDLSK